MSNAKIQQALGNLFDKQRIVFWYDTRREFRADYEALSMPGVEKIDITKGEKEGVNTITIVSKGYRRSKRIEQAIADAIGTSPAALWPSRYPADSEKEEVPMTAT